MRVVERLAQVGRVDPQRRGGVALGIGVDHQYPVSTLGDIGGEIDCGGGFADAALLIDHRR